MKQNIRILTIAFVIILLTSTAVPLFISNSTAATPEVDSGWTLVTNARALKVYPNLIEYVWQKTPNLAPNTSYDKIALHRLVKNNTALKGVLFLNPGTYGSFESLLSNVNTENNSQPIYWANQGFDVYGIDYRTHFVPRNINDTSQLVFMADWGWDQWINDIKEAVDKTKEVSGASKMFMAGQSFGGTATMFYASRYQQDLRGLILLDGGSTSQRIATNTNNLTASIETMKAKGTWAFEMPNLSSGSVSGAPPGMIYLYQFAYAFPGAPANVPGTNTPLPPAINPLTNKTFANITEWMSYSSYSAGMSNTLLGYSNSSQSAYVTAFLMDRYWPSKLSLEQACAYDWTNCQQVTFDFDDNFKLINVPVISFSSELYGLKVRGNVTNGMATPDFTQILLAKYGHMDVFGGLYSARDVSLPTLKWMTDRTSSNWVVTTTQTLKAYPNLLETIWQKNPTIGPNSIYDKIGLHRLVNPSITTKGVILLTDCPTWGTGEERISNPPSDNWTKYENFSQAIYLANRGFDVYAIDYRTHFVPDNLPINQTGYMASWGWDVWVSDIKDAADQVKATSGTQKFFISGECSGAEAALNYATKYQSDLRGIILLDANFLGVSPPYPIVGAPKTTNTYNLTTALAGMNRAQNWTREDWPQWFKDWVTLAMQKPGAPAIGINGTAPTPPINPLTNKTWANITEYFAFVLHYLNQAVPGLYSNILGGKGNITQDQYCFLNSEYVPLRLYYENTAMADWVNCPYLSYDYNDHYKDITVPVIAFAAGIFANRTGQFQFVNGMATSDFTGIMLPGYGHMDVFIGTNSAKDVSQPTVNWMQSHYQPPAATTFSSTAIFAGQTWYFCVHSNGGVSPHKYQWYEGNTPIAGQTAMVLAASKPSAGTYTYYCKVTDAEGATTNSSPVTLTVR